ncbi:MAG TPA: cupin domain-containing protein [Casimicrobiaceae bacterium]|jgi:quercetin dioxygenase-like cupin family protein|nr:cupin domain-containing protein [Casimicrobiaceae bacterium]HSC23393.1 cupin domain-containing protein [Casimicrobiaceae bacterium]
MAIPHAGPNEIIDVRPLGREIREQDSQLLIRTEHLQVFRYALPSGKSIQEHTAAGLMILLCLEGAVAFAAQGRTQTLGAGDMLYLADGAPHSLEALADSSLLVTILLHRV